MSKRKDSSSSIKSQQSTVSSSAESEKKPESRKSSISSVKPDDPNGTPTIEGEQVERPNSVISTVSHAESAVIEEKSDEAEKNDESGVSCEQEAAEDTENKIEVNFYQPRHLCLMHDQYELFTQPLFVIIFLCQF